MSSSQFSAGQARGQGEAEANSWVSSVTGSAQAHRSDSAQSVQEGKEHAAGFLQQTGQQVMNMAHGAMDTVKNTLGMGDASAYTAPTTTTTTTTATGKHH